MKINKKYIVILLLYSLSISAFAETWDHIQSSGEYYYGVGVGATEEEADRAALANLVSQIAVHVSSDFSQIENEVSINGNIDHQSKVQSCVKTYSQATIANAHRWPAEGTAPNITVRRYMKRSELTRIYENRITKAKNMIAIAEDCLADKKIDMALQYYYWGYSLIRSVQFPNEVRDDRGRILVNWLPMKIDQILSDINVEFDKKDGCFTDLFFNYKGEPVSSLEFSYSDGETKCQGLAKSGRGSIERLPGYETDKYSLDIEYEYKSQARGDYEVESVLDIISPRVFPKASIKVAARDNNQTLAQTGRESEVASNLNFSTDQQLTPAVSNGLSDTQNSKETSIHSNAINGIINAITNRSYSDAFSYFTVDGLGMFNRLTGYGKARILDSTNIRFYKGLGGRTIARGLKMSFSFNGRRKKTFVEDVSFTFDKNNKIENVAFGLGDAVEDGIFNSKASWSQDVREIIVSFMENYKTAYSLERLDYLRDIFADDAVIIVGNLVKKNTSNPQIDGKSMSLNGQDVIKYNRYTKDDYIANLSRCFNRNDFINLRFTNHQIQWLEKFDDQKIFAINIRQEYNSSTYADDGYLFLLVDMTDTEAPLIKVRTWQPNEVAIEKLYNAGDFFND